MNDVVARLFVRLVCAGFIFAKNCWSLVIYPRYHQPEDPTLLLTSNADTTLSSSAASAGDKPKDKDAELEYMYVYLTLKVRALSLCVANCADCVWKSPAVVRQSAASQRQHDAHHGACEEGRRFFHVVELCNLVARAERQSARARQHLPAGSEAAAVGMVRAWPCRAAR